jgi:lysophospholipase L1-like esterase
LFDNQDLLQTIFLKILSKAPIAYERLAIWAKVEKARRAIGAIGFGSPETNRFGRTEDFQLLETTNSESFEKRLSDLVSQKTSLSKPIRAIISYAKQNDLEIIFALMPMTSDHRLKFNSSNSWNAYFSHIRNLLEKDGIKLVNALDWMDDYLFEDNLHLSKAGAGKFSKRLGESLK